MRFTGEAVAELGLSPDLGKLINTGIAAGAILLRHRGQTEGVRYKSGPFDPVLPADEEADGFIRESLSREFPLDEILTEEHDHRPASYTGGRVHMGDPMDGSNDYLHGLDCFSTLLGTLEAGRPRFGVAYAPARDILWFAEAGRGAFKVVGDGPPQRLRVSGQTDITRARLFTRHMTSGKPRPIEKLVEGLPFAVRIQEGSAGIRIAGVADGSAEAYVHTAPSRKWDTLGPQVILAEAGRNEGGSILTDIDGNLLDYGREGVGWPRFLVAANNPRIHERIIEVLREYKGYSE
jgi:fructose-1,6-bisphosphatase/inositol monophosphatase family enzyme